jgi:multiple sugar transport system permease protein
MFSRLGWIDTHFPLWVPAWFGGGAWNIFLFRQFFASLPRELEEAAQIDGAGRLRTFWSIILPNSKAVLAVVTVFSIQGFWTDIFNPVIYLNSRENYTLALGVTTLIGAQVTRFGPLMAASVLMTVPMILLYFFVQRYIAEGLVTTGIKG